MILNSANTAFSTTGAQNIHWIKDPRVRMLVSESLGSWRNAVENRMSELLQLANGWDGYRGQPVKFPTAMFAMNMLQVTCDLATPAPQIVPGIDGDLQLEWHTAKADIEIHILAPFKVHAWRKKLNSPIAEDEIMLTNEFSLVGSWLRELAEAPIATRTAAA